MKSLAFLPFALLVFGCSRSDSGSHAAPIRDASADAGVSAPSTVDASVAVSLDAGVTLDAYCREFVAHNDSAEGFMCRGDSVHPACGAKEKKALPTLGTIALADEKGPDGTRKFLAIVDPNRHFAILDQVKTEDCDLGDPADVSIELVSASESSDAGPLQATLVFDTLRNDPPFQGGARILTATRRFVHCHAGANAPECDAPATLGAFTGPMLSDKPPPFSQWKKKN